MNSYKEIHKNLMKYTNLQNDCTFLIDVEKIGFFFVKCISNLTGLMIILIRTS